MMKRCNGSYRSKIVQRTALRGDQIIILCVAWYTNFKLSLRDLVITMADRGISVTHTTILRWVQRYLQNSKSACGVTLGLWADRGGWTRPI
jgi:hypothetical protein